MWPYFSIGGLMDKIVVDFRDDKSTTLSKRKLVADVGQCMFCFRKNKYVREIIRKEITVRLCAGCISQLHREKSFNA